MVCISGDSATVSISALEAGGSNQLSTLQTGHPSRTVIHAVMVQERKGEEPSVSLDVGDAQTLQKGRDTRLQMGAGPGSLCGVHTILSMMVSRGPKLPGRRSEAMSSRSEQAWTGFHTWRDV